ncbi:hypothetical protein GOBAR_AA11867 [Gossypium barbadense]|uniref:Uncharacterized protein n=1 Tax=Gossypium barbadense TaxID=3634 RepID=A0A2P5XZL4_GOSBA|nr:hypothetical protein GOBAR_AA11867 [Gossypium barbadense]
MLSKFISVSETHFQNTETALKNQQASIQGLETQIGQLSKLISERPQGSLPNKEGFIAPEPELQQDNTMNKGREEIEELDEWREHKPRTHDKLKLRKNKSDTSPNQLKVGDTILLDVVDPHINTTTPNEEIPLMVLNIFPFGTVEVSHPKFGTFKHTWLDTRACLRPWPSRGRNTTVRYSRVEAGHDFPKTRDEINLHGCATSPWVNLIGEHGRGKRNPWACQGQGSILFLRQGHPTRPCHSAVDNNTGAWYLIMGGGKANTARHGRAIWPCTTHVQETRAWDSSQARTKIAKFETHGLNLIRTREWP